MPLYDGKALAQEGLLDVAKHCAQSALHAPQLTGTMNIKVEIVTQDELLDYFEVEDKLHTLGLYTTSEMWKVAYDAGEPPVVLLVGADCRPAPILKWDCGACGYDTCVQAATYQRQIEKEKGGDAWGDIWKGPNCIWKIMEMGIACDWAAAAAHNFNVDSRVQMIAGGIFMRMGYLEGCSVANAIPLGPNKEHWYFEPGTRRPGVPVPRDFMLDLTSLWYPSMWIKFVGPGPAGTRVVMRDKDNFWEAPHRYLDMQEDADYDEVVKQRIAGLVEITDEVRKRRQAKK